MKLEDIDKEVFEHADTVWCKVDQLEGQQGQGQPAPRWRPTRPKPMRLSDVFPPLSECILLAAKGKKISSWLDDTPPLPRTDVLQASDNYHAMEFSQRAVHGGDLQQVSEGVHGHKSVLVGDLQQLSEVDHGHKPVSAVEHQPVSEKCDGYTVVDRGDKYSLSQLD